MNDSCNFQEFNFLVQFQGRLQLTNTVVKQKIPKKMYAVHLCANYGLFFISDAVRKSFLESETAFHRKRSIQIPIMFLEFYSKGIPWASLYLLGARELRNRFAIYR
jgi:hypothetical protein